MDLSAAIVAFSAGLASAGNMSVPLLIDEVEARTQVRLARSEEWPESHPVIWVGTENELATLPASFADSVRGLAVSGRPEGYRVKAFSGVPSPALLVIGHDGRGAQFGAGQLLRRLHMRPGCIAVADDLDITAAPQLKLRGHQLGYRFTPNSYDAWDLDRWEQYYRDLIVFGANAVELIPPFLSGKSRTPPPASAFVFPRPEMEMNAAMSALADKYDLDVWLWYPALAGDYSDENIVRKDLAQAEEVFRKFHRIDEVFVPGGEPTIHI